MAKTGDTAQVSKTIMGQFYQTLGQITRVQRRSDGQLVQINSDWWTTTNDNENSFQIIKKAPGQPQKADDTPSCHYCGMPATSFGFFDEPACPECGG